MASVQRVVLFLCLIQIQQITYSIAHEIEYFVSDEGWRPMRGEQIYNGSPGIIPRIHQMNYADYFPKQADEIENIDKLRENVIKLVKAHQFFSEFNEANDMKDNFPVNPRNIQDVLEQDYNQKVNDSNYGVIKRSNNLENKSRKAKTLLEGNTSENVIKDLKNSKNNDADNRNKDVKNNQVILKTASKRNATSYDVTENFQETQDNLAGQTVSGNSGYFYNPPGNNQLNEEKVNNLRVTFNSILSKYKINEADNSRNYALSRNLNQRYLRPQYVFLPIPLKALKHHNSPNHLPVDPLLAVYLSNYGYYLPGSYGPQNHFRNLYGYLASNNIHNNKPFGHYKVFSDTDSSNK